eukprot:TRINITY_DN2573_c0_g1_i4.p1 TRINITY_DN2573_c0_g1~~TRINITY_DN2573_c0_g1_i4.p1  ORF type:complete len:520 (+),score=188.40 TRINITY_DN2573_c0_g1_i4:230-1561(+)
MSHLTELEKIAESANMNRAVGTKGYNDSVNYVVERLQEHSYALDITTQFFPFTTYVQNNPSELRMMAPGNDGYVYGTDFVGFQFQGSGNVTARVNATGLGCEDADYNGFVAGNIALVKRGNCDFVDKVNLAVAKGASALLMINNEPGLEEESLDQPTLIPVFLLTKTLGETLAAVQGLELFVFSDTSFPATGTMNICAQTKQGRADRVILVGSHLDSVPAGPGINDNGSGSSANLEFAILMSKLAKQNRIVIKNRVRFCWWAAEEVGLVGSTHYVNDLKTNKPDELAKIALNLNYDMLGSPNYEIGVYNGADAADANIRTASTNIEKRYTDYLTKQGYDYNLKPFDGRSDYGPFIANGIPAGGLFSGAEQLKTQQMRDDKNFGFPAYAPGMANAPFDACYHKLCDNVKNINQNGYSILAKAAADALQFFATVEDLDGYLATPV